MIGSSVENPFRVKDTADIERIAQDIADLLQSNLLAYVRVSNDVYQILSNRRGKGFSTLKVEGSGKDIALTLQGNLEEVLIAR